MVLKPFSIPHDAAEPVGYSVFSQGVKMTVATDIGHVDDVVKEAVADSDVLLLGQCLWARVMFTSFPAEIPLFSSIPVTVEYAKSGVLFSALKCPKNIFFILPENTSPIRLPALLFAMCP